jgi:hypothetical protein
VLLVAISCPDLLLHFLFLLSHLHEPSSLCHVRLLPQSSASPWAHINGEVESGERSLEARNGGGREDIEKLDDRWHHAVRWDLVLMFTVWWRYSTAIYYTVQNN